MPAIGKDLSKIRSHLGLTIQDIQHETKIPVSTLKTIEDGSIFDHPEENQTYIRSFVRSYGRALKIDDSVMIKALDQNETGNYNHLLLQGYPELQPEKPAPPPKEEQDESESPETHSSETQPPPEKKPDYLREGLKKKKPVEEPGTKPEVAEETTPRENAVTQKNDPEPSVKSVDWADVGRKFSQEKKHTPVWIIVLIIVLIIAVVAGYFLYQNGFLNFSSLNQTEQQEQIATEDQASQSSVSLDLEDADSPAPSEEDGEADQPSQPAAELDDVLELTVYAAYGALGPVRVWSDLKPRMDPYWFEQGTAMHFQFSDTIRVRGSYPDLLLFKDGHIIENASQRFLQQEENYIEITRDFFATDEKWATSVDYELPEGVEPPDSIATRPTF